MRYAYIRCCFLVLAFAACSEPRPHPPIDYYPAAFRQLPPEPVYGRVTWSHLPEPFKPRVHDNAPLLLPTMTFEFPRSTLGETVQALAQALGYTWSYPEDAAKRPIAIKMTATAEEILNEIGRQAQVYGVFDHDQRVVRVITKSMVTPELPIANLERSS